MCFSHPFLPVRIQISGQGMKTTYPYFFHPRYHQSSRTYEPLIIWALNFLRFIQKQSLPSFFLNGSTVLAQGLSEDLIPPISNISQKWVFTSSYMSDGIYLFHSLKGVSSVYLNICFIMEILPKTKSFSPNNVQHSCNRPPTSSCSSVLHSFSAEESTLYCSSPSLTFSLCIRC